MAGLHERWHVVRDFSRAASRQDGDDWFGGIQSEKCRELLTRFFCGHIPHQGMPDKIRRYPARAIPILFERENAEPAHESTTHQVRTPRPPGPELRANKIDILHALLLQCLREAQMEAGEIREDRKTRPPSCGLSDQAFPHAIQRRELLGNFNDSDQRHFGAIGYQFNSRFPHVRPAHSVGMGGPHMREAGVELVADCAEVSLVGIVEIAKKLPALNRVWKRLIGESARRRPRFAIHTDFPGFHLRLARALKQQGVQNIYFVCPQFWAWRPWRANLVRRRFVRGL